VVPSAETVVMLNEQQAWEGALPMFPCHLQESTHSLMQQSKVENLFFNLPDLICFNKIPKISLLINGDC